MRKFLIICIVIFNLCFNVAFALDKTSTHSFPVSLEGNDIPEKVDDDIVSKDDNGGLSGGAITAISLGSVGVLGACGFGYFLLKKYSDKGLTLNKVYGQDSPIISLCFDKKSVKCFCEKYKENKLLAEIFEHICIKECPNSKYITIPDTSIKNKTYDIYILEVPKGLNKIRVFQNSQYKNLKFSLYTGMEQKEEIKLSTLKRIENEIYEANREDVNFDTIALFVEYNENLSKFQNQKYAYVIEFSK